EQPALGSPCFLVSLSPYLLSLFLVGAMASQQARAGDEGTSGEPPLAGRPVNFSGAVGTFRVSMTAEPTVLQAEDPLVLTVRITGSGDLQQVQRPDLRRLANFSKRFLIENLGQRDLPGEKTREFTYQLRPRHAGDK